MVQDSGEIEYTEEPLAVRVSRLEMLVAALRSPDRELFETRAHLLRLEAALASVREQLSIERAARRAAWYFLKTGKERFAPHTTNSDVDQWLQEWNGK